MMRKRSESGKLQFEKMEHLEECLESLYSGYTPLKFAYSGSASRTHDLLGQSKGYQSVVASTTFESSKLEAYFGQEPQFGPRKWVEIGPGNGVHSIQFWTTFTHLRPPTELLLIDFSETLLRLASRRLRRSLPFGGITLTRGRWDIEVSETRAIKEFMGNSEGVVMLFGNTLGNVEKPEIALLNVRASLPDRSRLCVSWAAYDDELSNDQVLQPYRNDVFAAAALEPLRMVGIRADALRMELLFNRASRTVECYYPIAPTELENWSPVEFDKLATSRVRVFKSRRADKSDIEIMASQCGFQVDGLWQSPDKNVYLGVLVPAPDATDCQSPAGA